MRLCTNCGDAAPPEYKRCDKCRKKAREQYARWRARQRANDPEAHRLRLRRLNQKPNHLANVIRYKAKDRAKWRAYHSAKSKAWRQAHRAEVRLRYRLYQAVAKGEIKRSEACEHCGAENVKLTAVLVGNNIHHAEWVCWKCHMAEAGISPQ